MRYALSENKDRIEVSFSGELARCEICNSDVKGRKGEQRIKHWYHHKKKTIDCDNWYEPISEWHLKWQNLFPKEYREVTITENNISHRADILLNNGLVIEFQNSPINFSEIKKREEFYGKNNLIWVLNGNGLAKKSILKKDVFNYRYLVSISIPISFTFVENYSFRELFDGILNDSLINSLNSDKKQYEIKNENTLIFKVTEDEFDFSLIQSQYKYCIAKVYENLYSQAERSKFSDVIEVKYNPIDETIIEPRLIKKYWSKFIDKMQFPVFIDNLSGLEENELYYYSENKIIDKEKFIQKYLKYT